MLRTRASWVLVGPAVAGLFAIVGCQASGTASIGDRAVTGDISDLGQLVAKTQVHHRRPFRKPYRDENARTMRLLARKADAMLADVGSWGGDARLTGADVENESGQASIANLRASLEDLKKAAQRQDAAGVARGYARVKTDYQRVASLTGSTD